MRVYALLHAPAYTRLQIQIKDRIVHLLVLYQRGTMYVVRMQARCRASSHRTDLVLPASMLDFLKIRTVLLLVALVYIDLHILRVWPVTHRLLRSGTYSYCT